MVVNKSTLVKNIHKLMLSLLSVILLILLSLLQVILISYITAS